MAQAPRDLLRAMFDAAVAAALPATRVPAFLPPRPKGRTVVVGAGKASAAMAKAVEDHWDGPLEGLVVTRYGHGVPCRRIEIVEAAHPVPDARGQDAAARILSMVQGLTGDDLVLALVSGGETTVTLRGQGRGGRNVEFLPALAVALEGTPGVWAIAGDTDGIDGAEEVAGAIVAPDTLARDSLERNDGHGFFAALGDRVVTGPTLTTVNDFRTVLVTGAPEGGAAMTAAGG